MSRLLAIATREYWAFVRTVGFWLSICLMPFGLLMAIYASGLAEKTAPPPTLAVVDLSGAGYGDDLAAAAREDRPIPTLVPAPGAPFASPADAVRSLRPFLSGARRLPGGAKLDAVALIEGTRSAPALNLWTREIAEPALEARLADALGEALRRNRLADAGLAPAQIAALEAAQPKVAHFSPRSGAGEVSLRDRLPSYVGFAMGLMLWSLILTGAGVLLNSVIEEKSSRILEVLLTSASVPEIMGGKILGAAAVTATALCVWLGLAGAALASQNPVLAGDIAGVLFQHGLLFYFALYFVGGYLAYATLFTTIGAFCETTREAQTLLGPLMILMSIPMIFMGQAIGRPDAPLIQALSWFPPFTPFLMAARAASGPPWWQVAGTGALLAGMVGLELWIAGRAFRTGALSSGRFDPRLLLAGLAGRGESA
ncbi:MAG: ABC transporter permease [Caulobacteraceae bacterium]|nr:ABC transporter permease [Caulobacteraceae bacterium]